MNYKQDLLTRTATRVAFALAMITVLGTLANKANAQVRNNFSVNISSSDRFLNALNTPMEGTVMQEEMCDNPNNRVHRRNRPAIRIDNSMASASNLTSFTLRIAADDFLFGTGDNSFDGFNGSPIKVSAYSMPGVEILGATISDVTNATNASENGTDKLLTVNFSGIAPGEYAIFNIDLDTSIATDFQLPDFRGVLFGADVGNGSAPPAYFDATYADGTDIPEEQFATSTGPIPYTGMNIRPYHAMDPIVPFGVTNGGVPEPTSFVLLGIGIAGLSRIRRRA